MGERTLRCPICDKGNIKVLYTPPMTLRKKQYYGSVTGTVKTHKDEKYEALENCPACKAKKKDITKELKAGEETKPRRLRRKYLYLTFLMLITSIMVEA